MSANFDNIDNDFRNNLKDYAVSAPRDAWTNIEGVLNTRKNQKAIIFYRIAAVIAALAILGSGYLYFSMNKNNLNQELIVAQKEISTKIENPIKVTDQEENIIESVDYTSNEEVNKTENQNQDLIAHTRFSEKKKENNTNTLTQEKEEITTDKSNLDKLSFLPFVLDVENTELAVVDNRKQKVKSYIDALPDIHDASYAFDNLADVKEKDENNWELGGEFTPLYSYRDVSDVDGDLNEDYYNNSEDPIISFTGGINVQYKAVKRLTIQAGVYYTTMGQSFNYMSVYANSAYKLVSEDYKDRFINSYSITNSLGEIEFNSAYVIVDNKSNRVDNLSDVKNSYDVDDPIYEDLDAEIVQSFKYIEVPLLLRYKLVDKNIDFNLIGGLGANFLIGNDVYLDYDGNKEVIGETTGVSTVNYNGTLGIGIEYPLFNKINIRLEPTVKYYINEINSNSEVESHPYSFGIYTGLSYSF